MNKHKDYYKILQVHYLAEAEVIESAYKRLAKKYHPDINSSANSQQLMQSINEAYEVLCDPIKRRQYNIEWNKIHGNYINNDYNYNNIKEKEKEQGIAAKLVLDEYFRNIINKRFDNSYETTSSIDKSNISKDDFINWQTAVSKVYEMKEYSFESQKIHRNKLLQGQFYNDVIEFKVAAIEYNAIMDLVEKNVFTKIVISENGEWKVFVGYKEIQPIISKFTELSGLQAAKSIINELVERYSTIDNSTGFLNRRGIIERIENEMHRFDRYGNAFSLITCEISSVQIDKINIANLQQEIEANAIKFIGDILKDNLRKLDVIGRYDERTFLVLLPECKYSSAVKVITKIRKLAITEKPFYNGLQWDYSLKLRAVEFEGSLDEALKKIYKS